LLLAVNLAFVAPVVDLALQVSEKLSRETVAKVLRHDSKPRVHDTCGGYRLKDGGDGCQTVESVKGVLVGLRVKERHLGADDSHGTNAATFAETKPPIAAAVRISHRAPRA